MIYEFFFAIDEWFSKEHRWKFKGFIEANDKQEAVQRLHYLQHDGLVGRARVCGLGFHKGNLLKRLGRRND